MKATTAMRLLCNTKLPSDGAQARRATARERSFDTAADSNSPNCPLRIARPRFHYKNYGRVGGWVK